MDMTTGMAFPKGPRGSVTRHQRKVAARGAMDAAYAQAEARDGNRCRVTGAYLSPNAVNPAQRREHHHLTKRSQDRGLIADPENVICVSAMAHSLITDGWIVVEGRRASEELRCHWNPDTPASLKIVRIKSRRWSQEDEA